MGCVQVQPASNESDQQAPLAQPPFAELHRPAKPPPHEIAKVFPQQAEIAEVPPQQAEPDPQTLSETDPKQAFLEKVDKNSYHNVDYLLRDAGKLVQSDRECVIAAVRKYGFAWKYASDDLKAEQEVLFTAFQKQGLTVDSSMNAKELMLAKVTSTSDGNAWYDASSALKNDPDILEAAFKRQGLLPWNHIFKKMTVKELWLAKVTQEGNALQYASNELKDDRDVVLAAVKNDGLALEHASDVLKADKEVVLAAGTQHEP